jgi:hypothetical protein
VCEVCERPVTDVTDPMDHGVCRDCWREHREETD